MLTPPKEYQQQYRQRHPRSTRIRRS
jgi:hypothetical protein